MRGEALVLLPRPPADAAAAGRLLLEEEDYIVSGFFFQVSFFIFEGGERLGAAAAKKKGKAFFLFVRSLPRRSPGFSFPLPSRPTLHHVEGGIPEVRGRQIGDGDGAEKERGGNNHSFPSSMSGLAGIFAALLSPSALLPPPPPSLLLFFLHLRTAVASRGATSPFGPTPPRSPRADPIGLSHRRGGVQKGPSKAEGGARKGERDRHRRRFSTAAAAAAKQEGN